MKVVTLLATLAFLYAVGPTQGLSLGIVPKFLTTMINTAKSKLFKQAPEVVNDFAVAVNDGAEIALENGLQMLNATLNKDATGKNSLVEFFKSSAKSCAANAFETGVNMFQPSVGNVGKLVTTMLTTGMNPLFSFFASAAKSCATTIFTETLTMLNPKLTECAQVIKSQLNLQSVISNVTSTVKVTVVSNVISSTMNLVSGNTTDIGNAIKTATKKTAFDVIDSGLKIVDNTFGTCERIFEEGVDVDSKIGSNGLLFQFVGDGLDRINATLFKGADFLKSHFAQDGAIARAASKIKSTLSRIATAGKNKILSILNKTKSFFNFFTDSSEEEDLDDDETVAVAEIVAKIYAEAEIEAEAAANSVDDAKTKAAAAADDDEDVFYDAEEFIASPI